jgi:hypothetical protein
MKKKLFYAVGLLLITITFTSCEMGSCQTCQTVSYENGNPIAWGNEAQYCDDELLAIKAIGPSTDNGVTTRWECR